ncbi:hypothetical protein Dalk_4053 [Desulfatibacillum aliphaticivorans]|uniref:Uncharacterized protein n=1 Tax=Desulfatibacillum aliphaticivorans TaxID=218208 RepID=B8FM05_DESAL|nr:hypothetical protein [Desulfatibacillum aliphaticivorans]ACL05738.1 hypothetical protein Dalk_4053 [Desulfatibacillum aliphaticivorans]
MEKFCFAEYRHAVDGDWEEPDLPGGVELCMSWSPQKMDSRWCLCLVSYDEDAGIHETTEWADARLSQLLNSARNNYPPALAVSLHNVELEGHASKREYAESLSGHLEKLLQEQSTHPFILAEALVTDPGYLDKGDFVWVIRYKPETDKILWVSNDFFIFANPAEHFALTNQQKQALAG